MRPTAKDLARVAGVSLATVDRVLNDRPNVSKAAVRKVNETIEQIGFVRNPAAVSLARNKSYRFQFILPTIGDLYLIELIRRMKEAQASVKGDLVDLDIVQIAVDDPSKVAKYLSDMDVNDFDGVALMAPDSPEVRDAISRLTGRGIKFVQFLCCKEKLPRADFVGVDNFAAGATAAKIIGRFVGGKTGKVMIVAETMRTLDSIQRRLGFDSVISSQFTHLQCLPSVETYGDESKASQILRRALETNQDVVAIYVLSSEARIPLESAASFTDLQRLAVVVHERTPFTESGLRDERIDAVIVQDCGHAIRSAIQVMRAPVDAWGAHAAQDKIRIEVLLKENL
ncbi:MULTISPECIES: LacI family DNA-binding transcriptional regulator [unclassified Ensifer]|uniref:LacI family DNA-binding transcriptional regulator n=1 Tax=unclassified Ensifer TaxID=2633371 RepID=UPI000813C68B|nr:MULTISPECIES: LacI family DNA-binding transcriptional regulator [unclassified Ensifer]OCP23597.1 LacI family transcriptional regulator [Ensifer sp. LC384]OCP24284.1 LacI family transcriptional regulator [Ensifer sp. LC54]